MYGLFVKLYQYKNQDKLYFTEHSIERNLRIVARVKKNHQFPPKKSGATKSLLRQFIPFYSQYKIWTADATNPAAKRQLWQSVISRNGLIASSCFGNIVVFVLFSMAKRCEVSSAHLLLLPLLDSKISESPRGPSQGLDQQGFGNGA